MAARRGPRINSPMAVSGASFRAAHVHAQNAHAQRKPFPPAAFRRPLHRLEQAPRDCCTRAHSGQQRTRHAQHETGVSPSAPPPPLCSRRVRVRTRLFLQGRLQERHAVTVGYCAPWTGSMSEITRATHDEAPANLVRALSSLDPRLCAELELRGSAHHSTSRSSPNPALPLAPSLLVHGYPPVQSPLCPHRPGHAADAAQ